MSAQENPISSLSLFVPHIFQGAQESVTNHRKNAVALRKFQLQCSNYNHAATHPSISDGNNFGENEFNKEFVRMVNKILPVKKGLPAAERVVAFIVTFVNYCREKGILVISVPA